MLTSLHPTSPTSDQAVRDLLDQRARASHTRYASVSFSQHSDSPSIYSRGDISPNPLSAHPGTSTSPTRQFILNDAVEGLRRPPSATGFVDDTDRHVPAFVDDNDNDDTSFISAPTPRPVLRGEANPSYHSGVDLESPSMEKIEEDLRMSLLGPKMRFVSRAPWEPGEDLEEGEQDTDGAPDGLSIFGAKMSGWKGKDHEKAPAKGLGLATFRSRSPGPPTLVPKKGGLAMNFGIHRHKTPEPGTPYGPYLSNASQSHGAINTLSSARSSHSMSDSQSSHNLSYTAPIPPVSLGPLSPVSQATTIPPLPSPKARTFRAQNAFLSSQDDSSLPSVRSASPPFPGRYVHPYANPDLLPSTESPPSTSLPRTPRKSHDRSSEEQDRPISPSHRQSESSQPSPRLGGLRKASAADAASRSSSDNREDHEHESKDFPVHGQITVSTGSKSSKPLYPEPKDSPMHNLISLEQARARARNPPRTSSLDQGNGATARSTPKSTLVAGLGLAPGVVVENGVVRSQGKRTEMVPFPQSDPPASPRSQDLEHRRPHITSLGKPMGAAPRSSDDNVPVKTLKHKRSAFMKFFQGSKDKEREKEASKESPTRPPAVRAMSTPAQTDGKDQPVRAVPNAFNVKRVPPPQLSVVVTSPSIGDSSLLAGATQGRPDSSPRLRQTLSLVPSADERDDQESWAQDPWSSSDVQRAAHILPPSFSAPPSQIEFKALSLRPVSTILSANFPDLLSPSSPPSNTPVTWNQKPNYPSPTTPGFDSSRSNSMSTASDYPITPTFPKQHLGAPGVVPSPTEDPSAIITALQEQIINSRKAWQRQIWELEGQVKDLKAEIEELRNTGECETCGKARRDTRVRTPAQHSYKVVDRPRPRTGGDARSVFGGGNDV